MEMEQKKAKVKLGVEECDRKVVGKGARVFAYSDVFQGFGW
jgi:hypothetical protein